MFQWVVVAALVVVGVGPVVAVVGHPSKNGLSPSDPDHFLPSTGVLPLG